MIDIYRGISRDYRDVMEQQLQANKKINETNPEFHIEEFVFYIIEIDEQMQEY